MESKLPQFVEKMNEEVKEMEKNKRKRNNENEDDINETLTTSNNSSWSFLLQSSTSSPKTKATSKFWNFVLQEAENECTFKFYHCSFHLRFCYRFMYFVCTTNSIASSHHKTGNRQWTDQY
jgi:hypothetical protein